MLDLVSFGITAVSTLGTPPGWIHEHTATLSEDGNSVLLRGGKLDRGAKGGSLVENIDHWRLHLTDWRWERLTDRRWPRWEIRRQDGEMLHLSEIQQALWVSQFPEIQTASELDRLKQEFGLPSLEEQLGGKPDFALYARRYQPPLPHAEARGSEEEYNVHRVRVSGVIVRHVEEVKGVQMTVEGELPGEIIDTLTRDLLNKLSALEHAPCELARV